MSDNLAKIKGIIEEHQTIRGNVKLVGDSITDQEALISFCPGGKSPAAIPRWIPYAGAPT